MSLVKRGSVLHLEIRWRDYPRIRLSTGTTLKARAKAMERTVYALKNSWRPRPTVRNSVPSWLSGSLGWGRPMVSARALGAGTHRTRSIATRRAGRSSSRCFQRGAGHH